MRPVRFGHARVAVACAAAAAAIVATAAIASSGSANVAPRTLRLLGTAQKGIGFQPDHKPRQGDRIGGGSRIAGDDTGISRTVCTILGGKGLCTVQLQLSRGDLSAQGLVPNRANHTPLAITGGTGAYNGARGTAIATQITQSKTRFTVTLRR